MTREEAIKRLEDTFEAWERWECPDDSPTALLNKALCMAIAALREQEELQERLDAALGAARMWCRQYHERITEPRWISVEERLPTEKDASPNKSVLAIDIHDGFAREWVRESVVLYPDSFTHWMPLPEPPKEDT